MTHQKLAHYLEFPLSWDELDELPVQHVAAISVLAHAVSETNVFRKVYLCQNHRKTGEKALDSAIDMHQFTLLRTWSSRLFEAVEFIKDGEKKSFRGDDVLMALVEDAVRDLQEIDSAEGFATARDVRHEAANHYSFKAALKNLKHVPKKMNVGMYISEKSGNEFYPLGESVMFHARLNRRWDVISTREQRDAKFLEWLNWCLAANDWLSRTHAMFAKRLIFDVFPEKFARKKSYWVDSYYSGKWQEKLTPIFFTGD